MRAKIYLHIGLHKTGTSSIQMTFYNNREELLRHGINFPRLGIGSKNHSALVSLYHPDPLRYQKNLRIGVTTAEQVERINAKSILTLRRALKSNRSEKIVFSAEGLMHLSARRLFKLRSELEPYAASFRVIVYVRDPYSTVESLIQQRVRDGQTYPQILTNPPYPRYSRIMASIRAFGRENVDIRIFDKLRLFGSDLIADFIHAVGAKPELANQLEIARTNEALSHEAAYLLHEINKQSSTKEKDSPNLPHKIALLRWLAALPGQPYRCPPEMWEAVRPLVAKEVAWLHDTLDRQIFSATAPVLPQPEPYWQEQTLAAIALKLNELAARESWSDWARRHAHSLSDAVRQWPRPRRH